MIDYQYLLLPLPLENKISAVVKNNFVILGNILRNKEKGKITLHHRKIQYDTKFAAKTFFAACYDFYIETEKLRIFTKKPVIVDVGANIGQFLFAVTSFLPNANVYSIEPDAEIYRLLTVNFSDNKTVHLYNCALFDKNGKQAFYRNKKFSEWSTLNTPNNANEYFETKVTTKTGDNLFNNLSEIDLLKIDVEGAEFAVLQGFKKTLKKTRYVVVETSLARDVNDNATSKTLDFLIENNFVLHSIGRIFTYAPGEEQGAVDLLFKNKNNK